MRIISEGPVKITDAITEKAWARRRDDVRLIIRDAECRGLALLVNPTTWRWTYSYRPRGLDPVTGKRWPNRDVTIGTPANVSVKQARAAANTMKAAVMAGGDPAADARARLAEANVKRAATLGRMLEIYAEELPKRPSLRGPGRATEKHVVAEIKAARAAVAMMQAGDLPVRELADRHIRRMLAELSDRPATARMRFGALSRFLDWCRDRGDLSANPCDVISKAQRPKPPPPRRGFRTPEQLAHLWWAAEALAPVHRDWVRFVMVVPCRRDEAARLAWEDIDLARQVWTQPWQITKNRDPHRVYLPALVMEILRARHRAAKMPAKGWVFPGPKSGKPLTTFSDIKAELDEAAAMRGWIWHDLRRSFVTAVAERAGVPEVVADSILNHRQSATRGGMLGVYQLSDRWPERVLTMEAWGKLLDDAIHGREPAENVVALPVRNLG